MLCPLAVGDVPIHQAFQSVVQRDLRRPAQFPARFADIRDVLKGVRRMSGNEGDIGTFAQKRLEFVQKLVYGDHFMPAEVKNIIANRFERQKRAAGNIVHVGKPARLLAIAGDGDRFSFGDPLAEAEHDHVRSASRTVDREVAQHGDVDAVEVVVGMRECLGAFFTGGVRRQGAFGGGGLGMWRLAFVAVEAGGGSQDKLGHPLVAGIFEHIQVARCWC